MIRGDLTQQGSRITVEHLDTAPVRSRVQAGSDFRLGDPGWMSDARCGGRTLTRTELRAECRQCTVTQECLEYAVHHGISFDVWGGYAPEERKRAFPEVDTNSVISNRRGERSGRIYIVRMGDYVKAGFTTRALARRLVDVRRVHPDRTCAAPEVVLHTSSGSIADERHLHADLALFRVVVPGQREWYRYCPELVEVVADLRAA